jgi:hypothetical protein
MTKKITYAEIPEFDQSTQYIVQLPPVETEDEIFYGLEVLDLQIDEENEEEMFI